ncbi:hypothetical protein KAR91_63910 [Candidatus Pacearchaeota archaeon]|nr:hypothetical protein [Candidatus Pacearchaeota archaeon]
MTIVLSTQYPGKTDAPSAGYPQGSFKNVTAPGAGDGTPWEKVWINDYAGFFQRLIAEAGITPSGSPDTILAGDHWDALISRFQQGVPAVDSGTASVHAVVSELGADPAALYNGLILQYAVNTLNTGAVDINYAAIGAKDLMLPGGTDLSGGELNAGQYITVRYLSSPDRFEIVDGIQELTLTMEDGIALSNNSVDAAKDIDFSAGSVCDSGKNAMLKLPSIFVKQLDAAWAVGTNAGGLFTGSIAADTWYHCFAIQKDSDGSVDCGFDTSITAANIPSGYTKYRYRGSILTDSTPDIIAFLQVGDWFYWDEPVTDYSGASSTSQVLRTISVPPNVEVLAQLNIFVSNTQVHYVHSPDVADIPANSSGAATAYGNAATSTNRTFEVLTNDSSQIAIRSTDTTAANINTFGWKDNRGKNV